MATKIVATPLFADILNYFRSHYPASTAELDFASHLSPLLFCPDSVTLPVGIKAQAEEIVKAFFLLRNLNSRKTQLEALTPPVRDPGNTSVLMSYDFHVDAQGALRLIEINTNASMSLLVHALYTVKGVKNVFSDDFIKSILSSFHREYTDFACAGKTGLMSAAIVDDAPERQKLFAEFLLYRELFAKHGLQAHILDVRALKFDGQRLRAGSETIDLVYNRDTDFYLQDGRSEALRGALAANAVCVSPNAHEYRLLADKERLTELSQPQALEAFAGQLEPQAIEALGRCLIKSRDVKAFASGAELWAERRKWFFKPTRSFGSKAAYRGSSVTKKVFEELFKADYVAQEFVPAPEVLLPSQEGKFKYDLRFFVYRDQIQLACARVYRGQMTNSQTPGGGLATIEFR